MENINAELKEINSNLEKIKNKISTIEYFAWGVVIYVVIDLIKSLF